MKSKKEQIKDLEDLSQKVVAYTSDENYPLKRGLTDKEKIKLRRLKNE